MKIIQYKFLSGEVNHGTEEQPNIVQIFLDKVIHCTTADLEANEKIAKAEAYNGEYTIEDDRQPDPISKPTEFEIIDARLTYVEMMTGLLEG